MLSRISDHALGVAGLVVGIVGAVGGLIAAAFGFWAAWLTKQGNDAAEADRVTSARTRLWSIQPRPGIGQATAPRGSPTVTLHVSNPGAAAAMWYVLITVGDGVYYKTTDVGPGWIGVASTGGRRLKDLPEPLPMGQFQLHASIAKDIDGNVWDLRQGEITTHSVPDILNTAASPLGLGHTFT